MRMDFLMGRNVILKNVSDYLQSKLKLNDSFGDELNFNFWIVKWIIKMTEGEK